MSHAMIAVLALALSPDQPADDDAPQTVAERSNFKATARYDDVVALGKRLAGSSRNLQVLELGTTVEGRPIPLWVVADPPVRSPRAAKESGKLVVLLVGNIHAGEACGKEALPMLARDLVAGRDDPILNDLVVAIVPIYNADGNEHVSKDNRPGQHGPEEGMGRRPNAQGLDLNRDFMKLDAPETRALVGFLNDWDPALVVDTHTTNGSYHRYTITYEGPKNPAGDRRVIDLARKRFFPEVTRSFEEQTGLHAFYYGNFDRDHSKWTSFPAEPRFGTTYVGLRNRLSVLSEAYAYASFEARVKATRDFTRACLDYAANHKGDILRELDAARAATIAAGREPKDGDRVAIRSEAHPFPESATILGYVEETRDGRRRSTGEPKDYNVELVQDFRPSATVRRPFAYLLPSKSTKAIEILRHHGIALEVLREDLDLVVEVDRIDSLRRSDRRSEGHRTVDLDVTPRVESRRVPAGSVVVPTAQALGTLAVYLLEPHSDDGLFTWNAFDDGLEVGGDVPVLRLLGPAALLTAPRPRPQDKAAEKKPITFADLHAGRLPGFDGQPTSVSWLDADHLLQAKGGRALRVEARTGKAEPYQGRDTEAMAKALAELPTIDEATARALTRQQGAPGGRMRRGFRRASARIGDPTGKGTLFVVEDDLYYATFDGKAAARLTSTPGAEEMPTFSPDGRFVAFVRDFDLYVVDVATRTERALTTGGTATLRHGKTDWVYFEEIFNRNWQGFWWSPDSKRLAFFETDDSPVKAHTLVDPIAPGRVVEATPYPRPGEPNPVVRLGVVTVGGGPVKYADLSGYLDGSYLISHVGWTPDGDRLVAHVQDRVQTWLDVVSWPDAGNGAPKRLFRETTRAWVESPGAPNYLPDGSFLWPSERDGYRHLYHYDADGTLKRQVTSGPWEVRAIHRLDAETHEVVFSATKDNPIGSDLYRVKLDGGEIRRLTHGDGTHNVDLSPDGKAFLDRHSDAKSPTRIDLVAIDGTPIRTIDANPVAALDEYRFAPRELVKIPTADGFVLEGELITPPDLDPSKSYPVWFTTYGGPHAPTVVDAWANGRPWEQALAQEGYIVFRADPRSASGKGAVSAWACYKQFGVQELKDIAEALAWLEKRPYVDGNRIGISGHSYGGFMTAFAMTHSDLFAAGIAGAPVTDWHEYDSIYTERYMLTPQDNPDGYAATSVVAAAKDLHGRLLILHGAMDDNVSPRNTLRLIHALQGADRDFELMIYPTARHGIFGPHYARLQVDFIRRTLGGPREREAKGGKDERPRQSR
ncbi:MAG TPA: DPP IV N-terminal domain-containing protein [Isosphaeraceae bacterium]|jgi:dipeptidyl aminopeptidase/acylaminoacyl peptidase|nr:DPP IV N-terminal domain-containing protein [Isosphaeraceae bacterium]